MLLFCSIRPLFNFLLFHISKFYLVGLWFYLVFTRSVLCHMFRLSDFFQDLSAFHFHKKTNFSKYHLHFVPSIFTNSFFSVPLLIFLPGICMLDAIGIDKALPNPRLGSRGDIKPTEWVYSRLDIFIKTERVILYFLYEISNFFINP